MCEADSPAQLTVTSLPAHMSTFRNPEAGSELIIF